MRAKIFMEVNGEFSRDVDVTRIRPIICSDALGVDRNFGQTRDGHMLRRLVREQELEVLRVDPKLLAGLDERLGQKSHRGFTESGAVERVHGDRWNPAPGEGLHANVSTPILHLPTLGISKNGVG